MGRKKKVAPAATARRGPGRPTVGKPMVVRLPDDVGTRIDTVMGGTGKRAEFIRTAVDKALARSEERAAR